MFTAGEVLPLSELNLRHERCRELLAKHAPAAQGLMVFGRPTIYYLSGSLANGLFWLPIEGDPMLLVRKSCDRARLESPLACIRKFHSYSDIAAILAATDQGMPAVIAAEQSALPWHLGQNLTQRLPDVRFIKGDMIVSRTRAVKSDWELEKMRLAGARHHRGLTEILPARIKPGMTERQIAHISWEVFFSLGHGGMVRMSAFGEEVFLGHISAGENGNHPSHYNGPLGVMGEHPAIPYMGNAGRVWRPGDLLSLDIGFCLEGYNTDKTQVYFAGKPPELPLEARRAHDCCLEIQCRTAEMLRPGAAPCDIYQISLEMAEKAGFKEGYMGLGENQVPFLGHGIGLTVDEWPVMAHRFEDPLQENMAIALEPKIGIPGFGMVGAEDTYIVTPQGGQCITGGGSDIIFTG